MGVGVFLYVCMCMCIYRYACFRNVCIKINQLSQIGTYVSRFLNLDLARVVNDGHVGRDDPFLCEPVYKCVRACMSMYK